MVLGIGVDLMRVDRLDPACIRPGDPFLRRTFSPGEVAEGARHADARAWYAARFAAKEAVFKALRAAPDSLEFSEIEILDDGRGAPGVKLYGSAAALAQAMGATALHVSLSYEKEYVTAFAVLEGVTEQT